MKKIGTIVACLVTGTAVFSVPAASAGQTTCPGGEHFGGGCYSIDVKELDVTTTYEDSSYDDETQTCGYETQEMTCEWVETCVQTLYTNGCASQSDEYCQMSQDTCDEPCTFEDEDDKDSTGEAPVCSDEGEGGSGDSGSGDGDSGGGTGEGSGSDPATSIPNDAPAHNDSEPEDDGEDKDGAEGEIEDEDGEDGEGDGDEEMPGAGLKTVAPAGNGSLATASTRVGGRMSSPKRKKSLRKKAKRKSTSATRRSR